MARRRKKKKLIHKKVKRHLFAFGSALLIPAIGALGVALMQRSLKVVLPEVKKS